MTQLLKILTLLIISQLVLSCNKDKCSGLSKNTAHCKALKAASHPTVFPLSYFPVYPGSYWKYEDLASGQITTKNTEPTYKKDLNRTSYASKADTFYVPYYEGVPIWGYSMHATTINKFGEYPFTKILSDSTVKVQPWTMYRWSGILIRRKVKTRDTTIIIKGKSYYPTIVMQDYNDEGPSRGLRQSESYYTKDIGLIMYKTFGGYPYDTLFTSTIVLVEHYINR
jgi:hypothetical protein